MSKNQKVGRNAHEFIRDQAAELVKAYSVIAQSKNDPVCINPEVEAEDRIYVYKATALQQLVQALASFAETGNFDISYHERNFLIRTKYKQLLEQGWKRARAIRQLMDEYHLSKTTIEDIVKRKKS